MSLTLSLAQDLYVDLALDTSAADSDTDTLEKILGESLQVKESVMNALMLTTLVTYREDPRCDLLRPLI